MPDQPACSTPNENCTQIPPPIGNQKKADYYIIKLIDLINTDKLLVSRTDLSKFDPTSLRDHYRIDLKNYEVEISHNKQPDSGKDFYIILFNNLKHINNNCTEKVILAYIHILDHQFAKFKMAAENQFERKRREVEEKRFKETMAPVDQILEEIASKPKLSEEKQTNALSECITPANNASHTFVASA